MSLIGCNPLSLRDIVQEKASGKEGADRPKYVGLLAKLRDGDKLVVWKVDRLGRSTLDALNTAKDLNAPACGLSSRC